MQKTVVSEIASDELSVTLSVPLDAHQTPLFPTPLDSRAPVPGSEEDRPIDSFINDFLKRHRIGGGPSADAPASGPVSAAAVAAPTSRLATETVPTVNHRTSGGKATEDRLPSSQPSGSLFPPSKDAPSRRFAKPSESQLDRQAMRQLANTVAQGVLESHGRVVMGQQAITIFSASLGAIVSATVMALAAPSTHSWLYLGALGCYAVGIYTTAHLWVVTNRLQEVRSRPPR